MNNIYDTFRSIQKKRNKCYNDRSAAFIEQGKLSTSIIHKRLDKEIPAAVVFDYKEGPDEVIVFSYKSDDLLKSDYYIYKDTNYLVYEDVRLTDEDVSYKKQKSVECNVVFSYEGENFIGYFKSSLRGSETPDFIGKTLISPDETPLLILPTNDKIGVKSHFVIEDKPFIVREYDSITNKGITYYYLERHYKKVEGEGEEVPEEPVVLDPDAALEPSLRAMTALELSLRAMAEYEFETQDAYFAASPKIDVLSRTRTSVKFRVPFGISQVVIDIKKDGQVESKLYKVVV